MRTLSGLCGAPENPAAAIAASPVTALPPPATARSGCRAAPRAPRAASNGVDARSATAVASSTAGLGSGRGYQAGAGSGSGGSGSRSNSTVEMSTPETPSTSAWWVLEISAKLSSPTRSTSHSSHSGLERSSPWAKIRPARLRSCSSPAGSGSAVWRTW